jgi:hypothetical protein
VHDGDAQAAIRERMDFGMGRWWVQRPGLVRDLDVAGIRAQLPPTPLPAVGLRAPDAGGR